MSPVVAIAAHSRARAATAGGSDRSPAQPPSQTSESKTLRMTRMLIWDSAWLQKRECGGRVALRLGNGRDVGFLPPPRTRASAPSARDLKRLHHVDPGMRVQPVVGRAA